MEVIYPAPLQVDATETALIGGPRSGGSRGRRFPRTYSDGRRSVAWHWDGASSGVRPRSPRAHGSTGARWPSARTGGPAWRRVPSMRSGPGPRTGMGARTSSSRSASRRSASSASIATCSGRRPRAALRTRRRPAGTAGPAAGRRASGLCPDRRTPRGGVRAGGRAARPRRRRRAGRSGVAADPCAPDRRLPPAIGPATGRRGPPDHPERRVSRAPA